MFDHIARLHTRLHLGVIRTYVPDQALREMEKLIAEGRLDELASPSKPYSHSAYLEEEGRRAGEECEEHEEHEDDEEWEDLF